MKTYSLIEKILKEAGNLDTEIIFEKQTESLTRFGDNEISQNVFSQEISASIRIIEDGKVFRFSLNQFDEENIKNAFKNAKEALKFQKKDKNLLPLLSDVKNIKLSNSNKEILSIDPKWRAEKIKNITDICASKNMLSYGILRNGGIEISIANSKGLYHSYDESFIEYELTVKYSNGYGWAFEYSTKNDINFEKVNEIAIKKAEISKNPISIKPGKYDVILEEQPANELLFFLCYYGFSAQAFIEKKSFVSETLGKKLFPDFVNISDNAIDGKSASMPFDFEGYPKQKVELVSNGIVKNIVTDRKTSKILKLPNTGHSLIQPNSTGPLPLNIEMKTGKDSLENMIKNSERAILVTQFHYTNCLKPKNVEMTGMTRNGTFLIENGKIKKAIKNLRFTQSAVEAFKNIESIGNTAKNFNEYIMKSSCPALKIKNFNFTSETEF